MHDSGQMFRGHLLPSQLQFGFNHGMYYKSISLSSLSLFVFCRCEFKGDVAQGKSVQIFYFFGSADMDYRLGTPLCRLVCIG